MAEKCSVCGLSVNNADPAFEKAFIKDHKEVHHKSAAKKPTAKKSTAKGK